MAEVRRIEMGHWTVNGKPACDAAETMGVRFINKNGRESCTCCACSLEDFHLMSDALLEKHPTAVCEWHLHQCPSYQRDRDQDYGWDD